MAAEPSHTTRTTVPNTLSVCIIVKNEAALLGRCLDSIKAAADEIVVVDTGSTDNTVEIAESKGAKVIRSEWRNDFAWARNISISYATGSWILWLDADDVVPPESIDPIKELKTEKTDCVFGFTVRNQRPGNTGTEFVQARMFPNREDIYFERKIHEQMMPSALRIGMKMVQRDIVVEHHGYADPATLKAKALRNVNLLIQEYNESEADAVTMIEIADSYQLTDNLDEAVKWYKKTLAIPDCEKSTPSLAGHAHLGLGNIYNTRAMYNQAASHLRTAATISPWRPDIQYSLAVALELGGDPEGAVKCLEAILKMESKPGQVGVDFRASKIKSYLRLVRLLTEMGKLADAARLVGDSLTAFPDRPEMYNSAGKFLIKCDKLMDALHIFEKSIMLIREGNVDAYIGLCVIYIKAGMENKAVETITALTPSFTDNKKFMTYRSFVLHIDMDDDKKQLLEQLRREYFYAF